MKKKRTWIMIGIVVVLIGAGGVYLATRSATAQPSGMAQFLASAPKATVIRTTLANSVESSGSVIPETKAQLSFRTSGTVEQVKVTPGDRVKQGDVLATLDTADLELKVTQAEQAYLAAADQLTARPCKPIRRMWRWRRRLTTARRRR